MAIEYLGTGLEGAADVGLATGIAVRSVAATVSAIHTSGYSAPGNGAGTYVSDALATSTLAAAHPRFCKQSLDGRYWRLLPEPWIAVTQGGAVGDGSSDDYAAIQAAIDYGLSYGGATIHFPAATYKVNTTPVIAHGKGLNLRGEGPDRSIIQASGDNKPAMKTLGWWRSVVEGLRFDCNGNTVGGAFEMDGEPDGSFGVQGIQFRNCMFFGNYNSKYVFTNQRVATGYGQGSECSWINCAFQGSGHNAGDALFLNYGTNALQNVLLNCNFQGFITGVKQGTGAVDILHCGFQSTYGYEQIEKDGWDVDGSTSGLGDTITMTGCRTESLRIYRGGGCPAQITGFAHVPGSPGSWGPGQALPLNHLIKATTAAGNALVYRVTTAGTTGGSEPVWPGSGAYPPYTVADGSVVWTQLDFNVFEEVDGFIARGTMNYGQFAFYGHRAHVEDVLVSRDDCFHWDCFQGDDRAPSFRNIATGSPRRPIKPGFYIGGDGARNQDKRQINHGNQTLVWSRPIESGTSTLYHDLAIAPKGGHATNKVANYFGLTGGWGFAQVAFADLVTIAREGVTYYVTDGTPGSSPLTGGGTGCLATYQNGAWRALAMGSAGGLSDGDKGDITVSASGATWTIDNGAVSLAKMADVATGTVLYRKTAGTGAPEVQTLATLKSDLGLTGTNSGDQTITLTGDVTGSGNGSFATTLATDAVSNAKLANMASATIKGRGSAGTGDPEDLTAGQVRSLINVADGASANSPDATLLARANHTGTQAISTIASSATGRLFGRFTTGAGAGEELTGTQATALLDVFTSSQKGLAPASGGGTANFLRADGTWATPAGGSGAPGGNSGELQYNNAGAFAGAANVEVAGGNLKLISTSSPAAPTGGLLLYDKSLAGKHIPQFLGPSGIEQAMQGVLHGASVVLVGPSSANNPPTTWGGTLSAAATFSLQQTVASANRWQATVRKRMQTSTTAGNRTGFWTPYVQWFRGDAAGFGGFFLRAQFGQNINLNGAQCFIGLCASTSQLAASAGAVSALTNMIGVGYDTTDASTGNWQLIRNDGSGTATKVDLGASEAARNTTHGYDLIIYCSPGAASEIFVRIINLHTGNIVIDTSYTTDLPSVNTGMALKAECNNGAVAAAANLEIAKVYIESDY